MALSLPSSFAASPSIASSSSLWRAIHASSDMTFSASKGLSSSFKLVFFINFCFNFLLYMM
ncbi:hypothetical protein Hanom_Chr03g00253831 [Helianthus anomalus]